MKNYIIFGATGGIGEKCVQVLSVDSEVRLICVGRNREKLERLKGVYGDRHIYIESDLSVDGEVDDIFGKRINSITDSILVDGVVYASGIEGVRPLRMMNEEFFDSVFRINCTSFIQVCKCMASKRYSNDGASIVAISSLASICSVNCEGAYAISKAAVNAAVRQASVELIDRRIRVNAVLPASTETDMISKVRDRIKDFDERIPQIQPLGIIDPIQIAYLIEFLLSDKSLYITGACIPVSGGRIY